MYEPMMNRLPDPVLDAEFYDDVAMKRAFAWVVDTILIGLLTAIIVPFTAFTALFFLPLLFLLVSFAYRVITISNRSATPGMRLMSVEFRNAQGQPFDLGTAFLHTLGFTLSMSFVLPQVISVILMATDSQRRGLTDMVLGTVALNRAAAH